VLIHEYDLSGLGPGLDHLTAMLQSSVWHGIVRPLAALGAVEAVSLGAALPPITLFTDLYPLWEAPEDPQPERGDVAAWGERLQRWRDEEASRVMRLTGLGTWALRRLIGEHTGMEPPAAGDVAAS